MNRSVALVIGSLFILALLQYVSTDPSICRGCSFINTKASDVWKNWFPGGLAEGFLLKSGLLDTTPLRNYLKQHLNLTLLSTSGRHVMIGASALTSSSFRVFNESFKDPLNAVMASSAIPGLFPSVTIDGVDYVDGGLNYMRPISSAIEQCYNVKKQEMGSRFHAQDMKIKVDVILACGDASIPGFLDKPAITPFIMTRTFFVLVNNISCQRCANCQTCVSTS